MTIRAEAAAVAERTPVSRHSRRIQHPLVERLLMSTDETTPPDYVAYTAVGGPLDGQTISVPANTTLFYYKPLLPVRGKRVGRARYRLQDGQLVWIETKT